MTNSESLVTRLFKARYFSKSDFLECNIGHNPSYVWPSIWSAKFVVCKGHKWCIDTGHNGSIIGYTIVPALDNLGPGAS